MKALAVIFDMDSVLLDSERLSTEAWTVACARFGYDLTEELNLRLIGRNIVDANGLLREALGDAVPVEEVRRHANTLILERVGQGGIPLKPGVVPLLDFLAARTVPMAVATSTPRADTVGHLRHAGLLPRFQAIVCGDEVPRGKPAPDIFLAAAERLATQPAACVVLEDSFAGIRAAHAARMIPIMVPDLLEPDEEIRALAYAVAATLDDAKGIIADLMVSGKTKHRVDHSDCPG